MGVLEGPNGRRLTLGVRSIVGRGDSCLVRLEGARVSVTHAVLVWSGVHWTVRDLGSSNGTFVGTRRLTEGKRSVLKTGARLRFANEEWRLLSDDAPLLRAVGRDGRVAEEDEGGVLLLADSSDPIAVIPEEKGWMLHDGGGVPIPVCDQQEIEAHGTTWILELPPRSDAADSTERGRAFFLANTTAVFVVSRDGEHVSLRLEPPNAGQVVLPTRVHQHALLVLARERLRDVERGLPESEVGWMYADDLCNACDINRLRLNIEVQRARRLLEDHGVSDPGSIVERRIDTQQIRIGVGSLKIVDS